MGWLGWTPDAVMGADVNMVIIALESRHELINMIFGDGKKRTPGKKRITPRSFKDFAALHNARHRAKKQ